MKTPIRFSALLIALLLLAGACTTSKTIRVMRPADIDVSKDVKKIVVVNRYKPKGKNAWINVLEGFFTGEMILADRKGADQAINGVVDGLRDSHRYSIIVSNEQLEGNGMGFFPAPLTTTQINNLCVKYKADAVLAVEAFDSDVKIITEQRTRTEKQNGKDVNVPYFVANENVNLTIGWRLYTKTGGMLDQHQMYKTMFFNGEGATPQAAIARTLFPVDAVSRAGFEGGRVYGGRIAPAWVLTSREFYGSGSRGMKRAKRMALRDDWANAAVEWKSLTKSDKSRVAMRATYNMAVAAEMMGDYNMALEWARRAADRMGSRKANNYIYILKGRMADIDRLNNQLAPADSTAK